jgi:hypothetical protein
MKRRDTSLIPIIVLSLVTYSPLPAAPPAPSTVVMAGGMSNPDLIALSVAVAAALPDADFLMDSPRAETTTRPLFARCKPDRIIPVGAFPADRDMAKYWGDGKAAVQPNEADPAKFARSLFPKAERIVVAPSEPHGQLLQAACLAGTLKVPLYIQPTNDSAFDLFVDMGVTEIIAVGSSMELTVKVKNIKVTELKDGAAVAAAHRKELARTGPIAALILANPADPKRESTLAAWLAVKKRAALLLTAADGKNAGAIVAAALKEKETAHADSLLVLADLDAIPQVKRDNPAQGRDERIDVEPWMPDGNDLVTLASARLFHSDRTIIPLVFARQRLFERNPDPTKILIASNPGDGLPLLETFSRNTGRELDNAGCRVTGLYGKDSFTGKELRDLLPRNDIFLWEGHYRTLIDTYEMPKWTEPLRPSIIFLQSCLALNAAEAGPLFDRGAIAVMGSPNRTYSGSGGAFSLGFFDALAYEGRSAGASVRHAKNFLLCYAALKEKRLGAAAKLGGANRRAAWTFTYWGDPSVKLPRPAPREDALAPLKFEASKSLITLTLPAQRYPATEVKPYRAEMWPGGRLAGLFTKEEDARNLAPLAFAEVNILDGPPGKTPHLSSKVPGRNYIFEWDARRKVGYVLLLPRERDAGNIEFKVHWTVPEPANP